jgi:hypothetical protein
VTADTVIRLVPPLIMTTAEADEIVAILVPLVKQFLAERVSHAIPSTPAAIRHYLQFSDLTPTNTPTCSSAPASSRRSSRPTKNTSRWPTARWR